MSILELSKKSLFVMLLSLMALMALVMLPACSTTEEATDTGTSPTGEDTQPLSCDENDTEQQCKDQIM